MRFTVLVSLVVVAVNVVTGTLIAWVLVRDEFPGKRFVNALIDLPFALPTIVAGLVLLALYGPKGPAPFDIGFTRDRRRARAAVRDAAVRRALGAAGADRARPRDGGGGGVARRAAADGLRADRAAEPRAGDRRRRRPRVRPRARRVRLGRADLRQHPVQDRGRVGLPVRPDRVRQHRRRGGRERRAARAVVPAAAVRRAGSRRGGSAVPQ